MRRAEDRGSLVVAATRLSRSVSHVAASSPSAPSVSRATGTKSTSPLSTCICSASEIRRHWPQRQDLTARLRWLNASVSTHMKSQAKHRPSFHGAVLSPSGRLPSSRENVDGSSLAGTSAYAKARLIRSLTALCLAWRPADS